MRPKDKNGHQTETAIRPIKTKTKSKTKPKSKSLLNGHDTSIKTNNTTLKHVCVYCGSGAGTDPMYAKTAQILGRDIAKAGIGLVYGGGGLGLMGEVARATIKHGGKVTGIIPTFLSELEHMLKEVDDLIITDNMHERKQLMFDKSDAFVALPGGIGTLEELVEQLTWSQLGQHRKPVIVANIKGYWTPFLDLIAHMKAHAFIRDGLDVHIRVVDHAKDILPAIITAHSASATVADAPPAISGNTGIIAKM